MCGGGGTRAEVTALTCSAAALLAAPAQVTLVELASLARAAAALLTATAAKLAAPAHAAATKLAAPPPHTSVAWLAAEVWLAALAQGRTQWVGQVCLGIPKFLAHPRKKI